MSDMTLEQLKEFYEKPYGEGNECPVSNLPEGSEVWLIAADGKSAKFWWKG
jgi:hypothetical protein